MAWPSRAQIFPSLAGSRAQIASHYPNCECQCVLLDAILVLRVLQESYRDIHRSMQQSKACYEAYDE